MKPFALLILFVLGSISIKAQNIEILKISDDKVEVKLSDGENVSIPLGENYKIVGNKISLEDNFVFEIVKKIGKYNRKRLKLTNNDRLKFYRDGNEVTLRDKKMNIITKGNLVFDENYNYLTAIEITDNSFADKQIAESWLILKVIHDLNPSQKKNPFVDGLIIGALISIGVAIGGAL